MPPSKKHTTKALKPLAIAALASGSLLQPLLPALAARTPAGTDIINRATATFGDNEGNSYDITSNEVTITVAEVAGITVTAQTPVDDDGGAALEGDLLLYDFEVTNTGNADSNIFIPAANNITVTGLTSSDIERVLYSVDGGTTFVERPADGIIDYDTVAAGVQPVPSDTSILVRVEVRIPNSTTLSVGEDITVRLGDTSGNTTTQNAADNEDTAAGANEVRTENVGAETPNNGEREASDVSSAIEYGGGVVAPDLALAQVTKTSVHEGNDPTRMNDDQITYSLGLNILNEDPADPDLFTPGALEGTPINLEGATVERVLISDRLPENTSLQSVNTSTLPSGWTIVYSDDADPAKGAVEPDTSVTSPSVNAVEWKTLTGSTDLSTVVRIGYIYDASATPLSAGDSVTGFEFTVVTDGYAEDTPTMTISNMAQVFGQTVGETDNEIVYDESGDANPNNYDGGTPPDATGTDYDATTGSPDVSGIADPTVEGTDTLGDNSGAGPDGEANVVSVTRTPPVAASDNILNGTELSAAAVGPTDDNDDYTNLSVPLTSQEDVSSPGADTVTPGSVEFTNTVRNPSTTGTLNDVSLEPLTPSEADGVGATGQYGANGNIPVGTIVRITWDNNTPTNTADDKSATYTYTETGGVYSWDSADTPVNVGNLGPEAEETYTVTVTLPANTPVLNSYSIPIVAFPDDNVVAGVGDGFTDEVINNVTIDRVFTGFMQVSKQARVINAAGEVLDSGATVPANAGNVLGNATDITIGWSTDFTNLQIEEGQSIEYRIQYENIATAEPATASNNVEISASNFTIVEDGAAGANNWATNTTHQQNTLAGSTTAVEFTDSSAGVTTVTNFTTGSDPVTGSDVEKYVNDIGTVDSGESGEFIFRRQINAE